MYYLISIPELSTKSKLYKHRDYQDTTMPVRIGKRRAAAAASDRGLNSNNSNDDPNRATDTDTVTFTKTATAGATAPLLPSQEAEVEPAPAAVVEAEEEENHPSNDDGCLPTPANVGSTLVTYEYNLSVMPGVDPLKAVTRVDEHMPVRIAQELGIWCDDDEAEDDEGMNRGRALAERPKGIYKLTTGEPDVIRTDGKSGFHFRRNIPCSDFSYTSRSESQVVFFS